MALPLDPQIGAGMQQLFGDAPAASPPAIGDWKTRRTGAEALFGALASLRPLSPDIVTEEFTVQVHDGATLNLRWFTKKGSQPGSGIYYIHGGGMILGSVEGYHAIIADYVARSGVPMLAVDYRLAPEHPHPTPAEDCYAGLVWMAEHAPELGIDPARIAVMGDSAGGCLAAATALMARDRQGPALKRQILIYPMLDDRTTQSDPEIGPVLTWTYEDNITGWGALLGDAAGTDAVSPYAAPARAESLHQLPPTYIEVGALDIFRDEDIDYARRLFQAGVETELHVFPGAPHAFESFAPDAEVTRRSWVERLRQIALV